jgi:hypothetical protein
VERIIARVKAGPEGTDTRFIGASQATSSLIAGRHHPSGSGDTDFR